MDSSDNSAERHLQDGNLQPFAHHPAQHEQDEPPDLAATSEAPDQLPDARRRRTSAITTTTTKTGQDVPSLPDDPTIRAPSATPALKPYYSLISDATRSSTSPETFYPRVRYVFSDDDPDLLTEAFTAQYGAAHVVVTKPHTPSESRAGTVSQAQCFTVADRAILLDLDVTPDGQGYAVSCATSLTEDWAVTSAKVQHLQPGSTGDVPGEEGDQTMVLNIEGSGLPTDRPDKAGALATTKARVGLDGMATSLLRDENGTSSAGDYGTLVQSFERRMAFLHNVACNSEEKKGS